jgi:glycosyltransferase involved in cell wall biosynthesis
METEITIDARAYRSGIGVYTANLMRELHHTFQWPVHALTTRERLPFIAPLCDRTSVVDAAIYSLQEQISVIRRVRQEDVLHVPHYNFPIFYRGTLLITIHDLTHLIDPHYRKSWKSRIYAAPMLANSARRAEHIFTVSEYSKGRIVEYLKVNPDKVSVVHNGVGQHFSPGDREEAQHFLEKRFGLCSPFILYVGNLKPHKNLEALLRAFHELRSRRSSPLELAMVGSDQSGIDALHHLASRLGISPHFISTASTAEVAQLYRAAEVLVLPSFEEGFGLPVIEAMASGTPVVCSSAASLPEIAGEAALYFDPRDYHELTDALDRLLQSPSLQLTLRAKGFNRASQFSWKETANRHVAVYRQVCAA